jgi:hypothetical protein
MTDCVLPITDTQGELGPRVVLALDHAGLHAPFRLIVLPQGCSLKV